MRPNYEGRIGLPIVKIQYALVTSMIFQGQSGNTGLAGCTKPNLFHITMGLTCFSILNRKFYFTDLATIMASCGDVRYFASDC